MLENQGWSPVPAGNRLPLRYPPISSKAPVFLHGGDYNPDQWPPEVWEQDLRLMKLARCNTMTLGVFSWARLEPSEGQYEFGWLDAIMDRLHHNGVWAILATPSGARPAWMSQKYPEVLKVRTDRVRILHGERHNHCLTSPVYRDKCRAINQKLAERYRDHPALLMWHVGNEYETECHCPLCQQAFRQWLQAKYGGSLERLNQAWWTAFWSHTYTDWSQIESPSPIGESSTHGLNLDWKRFLTHQIVDFVRSEMAPLRQLSPGIPVTTNLMPLFDGLDSWKLKNELDVISWDNYPRWYGDQRDPEIAVRIGFIHDMHRCLKDGRPFMMMESTPGTTNWMEVCRPKRPGVNRLEALQAVAHGSDTVQYFQWRKSRGSSEKLHGAVVDHVGHENTRVFREVTAVGRMLEALTPVLGTTVRPEVAVIYDWENSWAIQDAQGPRIQKKDYYPTCLRHYRELWRRGISADVIDQECDLSRYRLIVAPMLYLLRSGAAERITSFVRQGGVLVTGYWTGIVNETDLCFLSGFPGPLRECLGIWAEEIDALYDWQYNTVIPRPGNGLGLTRRYRAVELCDLIHAESAEVLAVYGRDFYAGQPALTVNRFGSGRAYYVASRNDEAFMADFFGGLLRQTKIHPVLDTKLPEGVTAQARTNGERSFVFLLNFMPVRRTVGLGKKSFVDLLTGKRYSQRVTLGPYGSLALELLTGGRHQRPRP